MNKSKIVQWSLSINLICMALLIFAGSASAQLTVTTTNQYGSQDTYPFTPTWTPASDSLISGLAPTTTVGNFAYDLSTRNVNSLTAGGSLTINSVPGDVGPDPVGNSTASSNYVSCGNNSGVGALLIYTLPPTANGYNVTNITVFGGWQDSGRDSQSYTVLYSTVANPGTFIWLTNVNYFPSPPGGTPSATQVTLQDASGAPIAQSVAAVEFDFTCPSSDNGWCGYSAITVQGTPATSVLNPEISVTITNENGASPFTPTWTAETPNLIAGLLPSTADGNFNADGGEGALSLLTAGTIGISGDSSDFVSCGADAGTSLIYTLTNSVNGSDISNIVVYSGWGDTGRDGQYYDLSYSTVTAPSTFIPITTVYFLPGAANGGGNAQANRVAISTSTGIPLGRNVSNLKFDFAAPPYAGDFNNGWQGYSQIIVQGTNSAPPTAPPSPYLIEQPLPASEVTVVGDQVVFGAVFSNAPPANFQWQFVSGGVTNNIPGATNSILTLTNVQLGNSGSYQLAAFNATNNLGVTYSQAASLSVSNLPAAVNNIIVADAGQTGLGSEGLSTNFYPTWVEDTNSDLILGSVDGVNLNNGGGNFAVGGSECNGDPAILSDGSFGYLSYWPGVGGSQTLDTCGPGGGAGLSVTYTLPASTTGWDLTNITVYGGWGDNGRDEQKYQVLYSTVSDPTAFIALTSVDFLPSIPGGVQSATRTTLIPAAGAMAHNVAAVQFNFNNQGSEPENGWEGYSEIVVAGKVSANIPVLVTNITPLTAEDVQGSQLILTASFSGATSYQWQKNGTNIPGATSSTLTLNNLQLTDAATNDGYSLVAFNSAGSNTTVTCAVTVDPAPAAVGNVVTSFAYQTSQSDDFGPTWDTSALSSSLIYQQDPPLGGYDGNDTFNDPDGNPASGGLAGGLPILTDGNYGIFVNNGPHPAFATCGVPGSGAGQYVIYTLGSNANGYNITNIQIAGGWNDNGRDSQFYTVLYSTVSSPTYFTPLVTVSNKLSNYGVSDETAVRATIKPVTGVLASNVSAIYVDFTQPPGVPNGYSGYSEISVFGSPATSADIQPIDVTATNENPASGTSPTWVVETDSLIEGQLPSSVGPGSFAGNFNGEPAAGGLPVLTDGTFGPVDSETTYATCGGAFGAGSSITYTSASGWNLTNIVVYSGWANYNRDGQFYNVSYSTENAPTTFIPLVSIAYNPPVPTGVDGATTPSANRVDIAPSNGGTLATNVYAVTFDFTPQTANLDNGYSGYAQIVLQGSNLTVAKAPLLGSTHISGGNLILTGTGGTPDSGYSVLTTTNLSIPLADWTVSSTGVLDANGAFSNSIPVTSAQAGHFFTVKIQ
ncbi:MAG: immunoglobulin domain-containing protein [Verrucomicrobiota bacterium]